MDDQTAATRLAALAPHRPRLLRASVHTARQRAEPRDRNGAVPGRRPAPHGGGAVRRLRREPDDGAPRDRRAAGPRSGQHHPRARHLRQAAAARRGDLRARAASATCWPTRASRPKCWRRASFRRGTRAAANLAVPEGTRIISIRRLLARGAEPLMYHRESLVYDPTTPTVESELGVTALRDLFEGGVGAGPKHGELVIHASVLTEDEAAPRGPAARQRRAGPRAPLLRLRRHADELGALRLPRRPAAVPRPHRRPGGGATAGPSRARGGAHEA